MPRKKVMSVAAKADLREIHGDKSNSIECMNLEITILDVRLQLQAKI